MQGGIYATGVITGNYTEGQTINMTVQMSTYHNGRYRFGLCVLNGTQTELDYLTEDCLDQHQLVQAAGGQYPGDVWYYPNGDDYETSTWVLPSGVTCDGVNSRCVLRWNYLTGNTCTGEGTPAKWALSWLPMCLDPNAEFPEQFWNCADIVIAESSTTRSNTASPSPNASSPPPPPSPRASPPPPPPSPSPATSYTTCSSRDSYCFCSQRPSGMYADEAGACAFYYVCLPYRYYSMPCPTGLLFNAATEACDWPDNVTC